MINNETKFRPVLGTDDSIEKATIRSGNLYFAEDSGKMYLDVDDSKRISVGGSGSGGTSFLYANTTSDVSKNDNGYYVIYGYELEDRTIILQEGMLILNITDGSFYRIVGLNGDSSEIYCTLIASSGGGSGSSSAGSIDLTIDEMATSNFINGADAICYITATSALKSDGTPKDQNLTISWYLQYAEDDNTYTTYDKGTFTVQTGVKKEFNFGELARSSSSQRLRFVASQLNSETTVTRAFDFTTSDLSLELSSGFSNTKKFDKGDKITVEYNIEGAMSKRIIHSLDGEVVDTIDLAWKSTNEDGSLKISSVESRSFVIDTTNLSHGAHSIKIELYQLISGEIGDGVDPIVCEVAIHDPKEHSPIIWLGNYDTEYYEYDTILIPYYVYDPEAGDDNVTIELKKNNSTYSTRSVETQVENSLEIVDAELDIENSYSIYCSSSSKDYPDLYAERVIKFYLKEDTVRTDFKVQKQSYLQNYFESKGRSNDESSTERQNIQNLIDDSIYDAVFTNFNWYNNGWILDDNKTSCLRISNGASLSIPIGQAYFSGNTATTQSFTFEITFKVRNVQDYSNLIRNITRYNNDTILYAKFYDESTQSYLTNYTNYDSFLAYYLKLHSDLSDPDAIAYTETLSDKTTVTRALTYDDLTYRTTDKKVNLNSVCCGYYSGDSKAPVGICLGTQDAFFSNGTNTVSVSYVEDEIINLAVVYSNTNKLMQIYINGVLTGVIKNTISGNSFTITSNNIVFNSQYCDIDIYRFRTYNTDLSINDILMNYAYDQKNVLIYDQNKLAKENTAINEYQIDYNLMIDYNKEHPSEQLMPYIIFDTSNSNNNDKLSYSKKNHVTIDVEFINTGLDRAYASGELETITKKAGLWDSDSTAEEKAEAVKDYYKHHCPSWIGHNIDMGVQGTSSEFYPRRNYKLKTKTAYTDTPLEQIKDEETTNEVISILGDTKLTEYKSFVHMMMHKGPFADDYAADIAGYKQDPYILSKDGFDSKETYYIDSEGKEEIKLQSSADYSVNTYYIKNSAYREYGEEDTRLKYFYFDNDTAGTTKFTMKIDFMESSGSYNMGFANLVDNAYSKHPLDDLNNYGVLTEKVAKYTPVVNWEKDKYYLKVITYKDTEGNVYETKPEDLSIEVEEIISYIKDSGAQYDKKIQYYSLDGTDENEKPIYNQVSISKFDIEESYYWYDISEEKESDRYKEVYFYDDESKYTKDSDGDFSGEIKDVTENFTFGKSPLYTSEDIDNTIGYQIKHTTDYRTSVQGFRVLAFHKKSDGTYQYLGMYNMLLDKGADEAYGFKVDKTTKKTIYNNIADKKLPSIAECWEFENNSRTFCSFRDPMNRKELSFDVYNSKGERTLNSVKAAPVVADSFEYRYNKKADLIDYIIDPNTNADKKNAALQEYPSYGKYDIDDLDDRATILFKLMKNWETAVKWVWSTNLDSVASQASEYNQLNLGLNKWEKDTYYILTEVTKYYDADENEYDSQPESPATEAREVYAYIKDSSDSYNSEIIYYNLTKDSDNNDVYENAYVVENDNSIFSTVKEIKDIYIKQDEEYVLYSGDFNESYTYYELLTMSDEELAKKADILLEKAKEYKEGETYYTYNKDAICNDSAPSATQKVDITNFYVQLESSELPNFSSEYKNIYIQDSETNEYRLVTNNDLMTLVTVTMTDDEFKTALASTTYYIKDDKSVYSVATENNENLYTYNNKKVTLYKIGTFYIPKSVSYGKTTYKYDTKEYRAAKFLNELSKHFDIEYMSTYFVMTEVFECYDSRGKNCMMASWGPQEKSGDYIWYPIFYDIDTQLGINNTGIPSFEYNIDATEDGSFSTSDSILWNNFYKYFKDSYILMKYKSLKGQTDGILDSWKLSKYPLKSVDIIEAWYQTDPEECDSIAMRGVRPLITKNLDEYYKYITITNNVNSEALANGVIGYTNSSGDQDVDQNGTYFYALQGDRSLSRRQFLTNRLEYIDSWLNQGNYQRGGANRIRGRIAANNSEKISDFWLATKSDPYYLASGEKAHAFDAEYWVTLTPVRSSYVTLGDDNEAYPSVKYDGINPIKFEIESIATGVKESNKYPEQLLYIYGVNQLKDLGDISKLYWQEFEISGDASKLTTLKFGYDGLMELTNDDVTTITSAGQSSRIVTLNDKKYLKWYNDNVNLPSIPAEQSMPLLKEVNFSNININVGTPVLNLNSCEKLENFRATGSNYKQITFAKGVALNTLYLPQSITSLDLTEARLLTNLITSYEYPTLNADGTLTAKKGLYIEGLFEGDGETNIQNLSIVGGSLELDSLKLLNRWRSLRQGLTDEKGNLIINGVNMTDVNWSPYKQLEEGTSRNSKTKYYYDTGHYYFEEYDPDNTASVSEWDTYLANGLLYTLDSDKLNTYATEMNGNDNKGLKETLTLLMSNSQNFRKNSSNSSIMPNITGICYIDNDEDHIIDEYDFRNGLQTKYPDLTFFMKNIKKAYNAKFVYQDENGVQTIIQTQSIDGSAKTWFTNPCSGTTSEDLNKLPELKRDNYNFIGWAYGSNSEKDIIWSNTGTDPYGRQIVTDNLVNYWAQDSEGNARTIDVDQYDYTFYAIYKIQDFEIIFHDGDDSSTAYKIYETYSTTEPVYFDSTIFVPYKDDSSLTGEEFTMTYKFKGWRYLKGSDEKPLDLTTLLRTQSYEFYPIFEKISVYDNPLSEEYFDATEFTYNGFSGPTLGTSAFTDFDNDTIYSGYSISVKDGVQLKGKITIPKTYNEKDIIAIANKGFSLQSSITNLFFEGENQTDENAKSKVIYLDQECFKNCSKLENVVFPKSLRYIAIRAFQSCGKLNIPEFSYLTNLKYIGSNAFQSIKYFSDIKTLNFPASILIYGNYIFDGQAKSVTIEELSFGDKDNLMELKGYIGINGTTYILFPQDAVTIKNLICYASSSDSALITKFKQNLAVNIQTT